MGTKKLTKDPWKGARDPRVTNEACWKATGDNLIPNPPISKEHQMIDEHYTEMVAEDVKKTKIIMAHEFRENPKGLRSIAQAVVDSYNEQHQISTELGEGGEDELQN
jgi:CRISPR/Cas system CSM-associated protein Csm4 (group 5 of RAMP superfamily)